MAFLLPASYQKQIVRYALSQLSFLDMASFDLDRLEGAWGRRSTGEIRDIPFKIDKLTEMLKLPPWVTINKAAVNSLRLTVPLNIWSEGIEIVVDGIDIRCSVTGERPKEKGLHKGVRSNQPRDPRQTNHDPGGEEHGGLPSVEEMAQSFVAHQTESDKERLRSELAQRTGSVDESRSSPDGEEEEEDDDDDEGEEGLGTHFSLPAIMADFLWGIGERLKVSLKNIAFEVDFAMEMPTTLPTSAATDNVTFKLTVETIDLKGVQATARPAQDPQQASLQGNHRLEIKNVQGFVVSEPALFAAFSAMSIPDSPTATHASSSRHDSNSISSQSTPEYQRSNHDNDVSDGASHSESQELTMSRSTILDAPQDMFRSMYRDPSTETTLDQENEEDVHDSMLDSSYHGFGSEAGISQFDEYSSPDQSFLENGRLDSPDGSIGALEESQTLPSGASVSSSARFAIAGADHQSASGRGSASTASSMHAPPISQLFGQTTREEITEDERSDQWPQDTLSQSVFHDFPDQGGAEGVMEDSIIFHDTISNIDLDSSDENGITMAQSVASLHGDPPSPELGPATPRPQSSSGRSADLQLSQSIMFSTEEAQSIYMSALGVGHDEGQREDLHVPGGWGTQSTSRDKKSGSARSMQAESSRHDRNDSDSTISGGRGNQRSSLTQSLEHPNETRASSDRPRSATSGSQTALRRRLFLIHHITLEVPVSTFRDTSPGDLDEVEQVGVSRKARSSRMPGEMSLYDDTLTRLERSTMRASFTAARQESFGSDAGESNNQVSIHVTKVEIENDMSLTKLLISASQQLLVAGRPSSAGNAVGGDTATEAMKPVVSWSLRLDQFSWAFVDSMQTALDASLPSEPFGPISTADVLLLTRVEELTVLHRAQATGTSTNLSVAKYSFGYMDEHVLYFDAASKGPEASVTCPPDISVKVQTLRHGAPDVRVSTAPLRVRLDLQRLDEAFGWFGGLSGVIGLSNSVMSTTTVIEQSRAPKPVRVRFQTPGSPPLIEESPRLDSKPGVKVTAVINRISIDLHGQASSVHVQTSPMKFVLRPEGIGLQIDKLDFDGPRIYGQAAQSPITLSLGPLKLSYLETPKEQDLARLLGLLSPSTQREDDADDDILVDTLLRQRRKGGVLRVNVESVGGRIRRIRELEHLSTLADEMKKLATVTKYLPEDDRPGAMILTLVHTIDLEVEVDSHVGSVGITVENVELACVTMPLLLLVGIDVAEVRRGAERLLGCVIPQKPRQLRGNVLENGAYTPMMRTKFIGNDLDPTVKIRVHNLCVEYHVTTLMAIMGVTETASGEVIIAEMVHSVANLAETTIHPSPSPSATSEVGAEANSAKPMRLDVRFKDCALALNPRKSHAKGLLLLTQTKLLATLPTDGTSALDGALTLKRVSLMVIDDARTLKDAQYTTAPGLTYDPTPGGQANALGRMGYILTTDLSEARIAIRMSAKDGNGERTMDVEVADKLLVLDSCADSFQTMISILSGLAPPMPPSEELKYRTEVMPVEDMLSSIVGEMIVREGEGATASGKGTMAAQASSTSDPDDVSYDFAKQLGYALPDADEDNPLTADDATNVTSVLKKKRGRLNLENKQFFNTADKESKDWEGTALEFNSDSNTYQYASRSKVARSPLRVQVKDVNLMWNLFDGYDWLHTRNVIGEAVADVEKRAAARQAHRRRSAETDDREEESVIGDFLFNSVYIGVGAYDDPRDLARQVNKNLADDDLDSASYATPTTVVSNATSTRGHLSKTKRKHLRLERSKHQKITIELRGVSADVVIFPPGSGETQTSLVLRVHDLEIFDHIRTSTWKKFATYMHDFGPRDVSTPMVVIELLNVRPVPDLPASELVMRVNILPLRLHVDQDAIDFLTRYFEFKDSGREGAVAPGAPGEEPFIQRFEIFAVPLKLDFKPKRVDYGGIRSGKTTEFMNFVILDGSEMILDHIILYGTSGFERLGLMLNDIWMPAIKNNQLPGVLAGLAPVRGVVNVGSGVKDLIMVPWQEYQKDGRLIRAIQKGAFAFAKNTTTELTRLGARVALGTQTVLQNAEELLTGQNDPDDKPANPRHTPGADEDTPQQISPYANQPLGVMAGLKGAYRHLERDMLHARDAVIAMPGEVRDSGSASGAARAVLRGAPTVILRPAMGVTRAIGTAFMGATNALDKNERRRAEDKYKRH